MISIRVNGLWLDIASPKIDLKITSPLFGASEVYGEFSDVPFTLMRTPNNDRALGWVGHVHRPSAPYEFDCEIFLDGSKFRDGKLTILSASEKSFKAVFGAGISKFARALETTKLSDITFPDVDPNLRPVFSIELVNSGGTSLTVHYLDESDFETQINIPASPYHTASYTNNYPATMTIAEAVQSIVDDINNDYAASSVPFYAEVHPEQDSWIVLIHELMIGGHFGGTDYPTFDYGAMQNADWSYVTNPSYTVCYPDLHISSRIRNGMYRHLDDVNANPATHVFPMVKNFWHLSELNNVSDFYNYYFPEVGRVLWDPKGVVELDGSAGYYMGTQLVPMFFIKYIIEQAFLTLGYKPQGAILEDEWFESLILFSNIGIDFSLYTEDDQIYYGDEETLTFNPAEHMPDISLKTFFAELKKYLGIALIYDQTADELKLVTIRDLTTSTNYFDIDDLLTQPLQINPVPNYKDGFTLGLSEDSNDEQPWAKGTSFSDEVEYGDGVVDLRSGFCWVFQDLVYQYFYNLHTGGDDYNFLLMPLTLQNTSVAGDDEKAKTGLKLLMWQGLQPNQTDSKEYALATQIPLNAEGTSVSTKSLRFKSTIPDSYWDVIEDITTFDTSYSEPTVHDDFELFYNSLITARTAKAKLIMTKAQIKNLEFDTVFRTSETILILKTLEAGIVLDAERIEVEAEFWVV